MCLLTLRSHVHTHTYLSPEFYFLTCHAQHHSYSAACGRFRLLVVNLLTVVDTGDVQFGLSVRVGWGAELRGARGTAIEVDWGAELGGETTIA